MKILGSYKSGEIKEYLQAGERIKAEIDGLASPILIAHHGDCDGITGAALLARYLKDSGKNVGFASSAEFRKKDALHFEKVFKEYSSGIFVEAQGMTEDFCQFDKNFINIDHHPHPMNTPIKRMFNPRNYFVTPNPAIGFVMYELLFEDLPANAGWISALASIMDYCREPAELLIENCKSDLKRFNELQDTFLASQYAEKMTTKMAEYLSNIPEPDEFLNEKCFEDRRMIFKRLIEEAEDRAQIAGKMVFAEVEYGDIRVASPLANMLQDRYPEKCVVISEISEDTTRLSVRLRSGNVHIGKVLAGIADALGAGDGTGHERAGSARIPHAIKDDFLKMLEERIG
ncbi:TPA: hypothetical protein DEF17_02135 [bacterium]|nr:MAG: hypothetical protein AUJ18_06995 [Candidatus Hydrogenedentes bacterium CG1_02_42_14]PIU48344.1 MAG: hypothetical protein COS94_02615 [Candidatus Hydrogenedentes bacterium CG07_land_8_20_14_0_80_42_17]HBW46716.1 hypothetical protein [bacterium]